MTVTATAATSTPAQRGTRACAEPSVPTEPVGPAETLTAAEVLDLVQQHPAFPQSVTERRRQLRGAAIVLDWLSLHPGQGWIHRWRNASGDEGIGWIDGFVADAPGTPGHKRAEV